MAAAAVLTGCGGSSSDTSSIATVSSTTTPATLSQTAYIRQADAACAESNAAINAIVPGSTSGEQAASTTQEAEILRDEIRSLQALGTPEGASPARFLAALQSVSTQLNRKSQALSQGNEASLGSITAALDTAEAKAQSLGANYGFKKCGGVSAPSGSAIAGGNGGNGATPTTVTPTATTPTTVAPTTTPTTVVPPGGGSSPVSPTTTPTTTTPGGGGGVSPGGGGVGP